jgi:hypothetical protein
MEIDITDIVQREYRVTDAKLFDFKMIQMTVDGKTNIYTIRDGKLYMYKEELIRDSYVDLHLAKFERIYRSVLRDKNIDLLTNED